MRVEALRLHAKLYRARAVDGAIALWAGEWDGALSRRREGEYHVVEAQGGTAEESRELLASVANSALVLTVDAGRG